MESGSCCAGGASGPVPGPGFEPWASVPAAASPVEHRWVEIPGGTFLMGSLERDAIAGDGETPPREVTVEPFRLSSTTVTNAEFARFVAATGYVTTAETHGWSYVFHLLATDEARVVGVPSPNLEWWLAVPGAAWRTPHGPGSSVLELIEHPVVHVSWHDARAYCQWAGARLPMEAEWERAARGGVPGARFPWGDDLEPGGEHRCNVFQGSFPDRNTAADGWLGTAPVRSFEPNGYGLYNVTGNVWEWCADRFSVSGVAGAVLPGIDDGEAPVERVLKGGSYLCHASYCTRYRLGARTRQSEHASAGNVGFRVAAVEVPSAN